MRVKLPLVAMSTELGAALSTMRRSKRAALISKDEGAYSLFTAGSIVVARSRGIKTLADLKSDAKSAAPQLIVRLPTGRAPRKLVALERDQPGLGGGIKAGRPIERTAPSIGGNYLLTHIAGQNAFIDLFDADLVTKYASSPGDCYCDGPRHHDSFAVAVRDGDDCPYNDGHTIVCAM